jgi:excinuclease ABC subunit C
VPNTTEPPAVLKYGQLPQKPGVYFMKDTYSNIIYIGKAKNLRNRVTSYFLNHNDEMGWKTSRLVSKVRDIDYVVTENEIEAFLLESNLIKRYRPMFNIELKDQQRYTYLKVTDEPFPRLLVARRNRSGKFAGPEGKVYGPFVRGSSKFLTVGFLRKLFKIRICDRLPKSPCLQYFIKNCDAPCIAKVSQSQYMAKVESLKKMLEGRTTVERFSKSLRDEMLLASNSGDYEHAKELRDTIYRLNNLLMRQRIEKTAAKNADEEYIGILRDYEKGMGCVMAMRRSRGVIRDRKKFEFDLVGDNSFSTFIIQYYTSQPSIPRVVYVNEEPESVRALEASLEEVADHRVSITVLDSHSSRRGIMDLVMNNLSSYIEQGYARAVIELRDALRLESIPATIDCFDISNLGTSIFVGACCRFANGSPDKSMYRKFRIKTVTVQDDFAMMAEIVRRRYSGTADIPKLIVVDGGKGQLAAARASLRSIGLDGTPCVALAKENEEIYAPELKSPLSLPRRSRALRLLQHLRDEAHRFGVAYNRQIRKV